MPGDDQALLQGKFEIKCSITKKVWVLFKIESIPVRMQSYNETAKRPVGEDRGT